MAPISSWVDFAAEVSDRAKALKEAGFCHVAFTIKTTFTPDDWAKVVGLSWSN
jgi:hypothetical protein